MWILSKGTRGLRGQVDGFQRDWLDNYNFKNDGAKTLDESACS